MAASFTINGWVACAPGLGAPDQWERWAQCPALPRGDPEVALPEMPAMLRRRLSPLGRMAAWAAYRCQEDRVGMPVVFASGWGDGARSLAQLESYAAGESLSPAEFASSVHNAIGAMYSIARQDTTACCTVAAGAASAAAALVEAAALLEDGAAEVMVVSYDAPLPGAYAAFHREPACAYAWAWRVARPNAGTPGTVTLDWDQPGADAGDCPDLPFGLDVMRFALSGQQSMQRTAGGQRWRWSRDA